MAEISRFTKMQKVAPINVTSSKESCPTDEELAAYIDGTLGRRDRKRIAEHLASCEDCFAVYMGTVRFQLDSEPAASEEVAARTVVRFPSPAQKGHLWQWAAAAAGLVIVAGGSGGYYLAGPLPALVTSGVTAPMKGLPVADGSLWRGPTFRGGGEEGQETALETASLQMGVQLVNLQVSLAANRGDDAQDAVARILTILKDQMFVADLTKGYTDITTAIENKTPPASLAGKASQLAEQAREAFDAPHLDLGQWVEAGRLAAIAGQPAFFERGENRTFLRRLLWRQKLSRSWRKRFGIDDMELDPAARRSLQDISAVLAKGTLGGPEYGKLRGDFEKILGIYYPES